MTFDPVVLKKIEIEQRMVSRLLLQFQHAPVLIDILNVFGSELQFLLDTVDSVVVDRSPLESLGVQLEGIGRIVGQPRIVIDYEEVAWFSPDISELSCDIAPAWAEGAEVAGKLLANDAEYRRLIEAKVYRNFAQYGSVLENQHVALVAFGVDVSYILTGPMSVDVLITGNTTSTIINILADTFSGNVVGGSIMPYPPTLFPGNVIFSPPLGFTPDTENTCDVAEAAVYRPL